MRVFVLGNARRPGVLEEAERLLPFVRQHCEVVVEDLLQQVDLSSHTADLTLVLGGDGAILRAARQMGYRQTPVLGVNLGTLGFLADLSPDELRAVFPTLSCGGCSYRVAQHLMFECVVESPEGARSFLGLNEVAVQTGPPFHMMEIDLIIDGEAASRYRGDGLIIATPVGSTAHSLSAGGPILGQELSAFVVTPICPQSLASRPVVEDAGKTYTLAVRRATSGALAVIDGQEVVPVAAGACVTVRRAPVSFGLVKVPGRSYYQTLRHKLNWGAQPNFRPEPSPGAERSNG
jgi:NAD+ kinase